MMDGYRPKATSPLIVENLRPPPGRSGIRKPELSAQEAEVIIQENKYLKAKIEVLNNKIKELEERVEVLISNAYDRAGW